MNCSLPGSSVHGISQQEYWSACHFLLQELFPTQKLNPGLQDCRRILYCLSHEGSPEYITLENIPYFPVKESDIAKSTVVQSQVVSDSLRTHGLQYAMPFYKMLV